MITNICLLLEALSIIFCLHCLYGEKFKLDIITVSFLTIYMIIMTAINYYKLPQIYTIIIHPAIAIYGGIRFGFRWRRLFINCVLYLVLVGGVQLFAVVCFGHIFNVVFLIEKELLIVNISVFLVVYIIFPKLKLYKLSIYLQDRERILVISLVLSVVLIVFSVIYYKVSEVGEIFQYVPLFVGVLLIFVLGGQLGKYRIKAKEIETELKMYQIYEDSFQNLIDEIRLRQHEFDNHINTIYSLHYTCDTYEELVRLQEEYGHIVKQENRHNKLLKAGNPLLIGFLYGKIIEIEKLGIEINYKISIRELNIRVPIYKMVELLGNLVKNAIEALMGSDINKKMYILVVENNGEFNIEVRNRSVFMEYREIEQFFRKGFSKKGSNRGLGLYNVKNICNEYSLKIFCENKSFDNENWISFVITNK